MNRRKAANRGPKLPYEAGSGDLVFIQNGPPNGATGWYLVVGRGKGRLRVRPPGYYGNPTATDWVRDDRTSGIREGAGRQWTRPTGQRSN